MKTLRYKWDEEIWLLHIEANNLSKDEAFLVYTRILNDASGVHENRITVKPGESFRFILSRDSAQESMVNIMFDKVLSVKIFRLQDRAYLPGDSDIVFSSEGTLN